MNTNLYNKAKKLLAGGVNSPVRSFKVMGIKPVFIEKCKDSYIFDVNGKKYIDFCLSWGAIILGHNNKIVKDAIIKQLKKGTNFGLTHKKEILLAELIKNAIPSIEKIRFLNSGTEAVMTAIRLARAFTKRKKILKFDGCYHGHSDQLLVNAGSGVAGVSATSSAGVNYDAIKDTLSIPYNDLNVFKNIIKEQYMNIACVLIEPVAGNMGLVVPDFDYLRKLRKITKEYGVLLIFDEIITGFRVCYGGVQNIVGVKPDLTCLGKIIGGGLPIGAVGGKKEIMNLLAPAGNVYQAGTFSGNPPVMTAGISVLEQLKNSAIYKNLSKKVEYIAKEVKKVKGIYFSNFGSMFTIFFSNERIRNFEDVKKCDFKKFKKWYVKMLRDGIFLPPSQFETSFISLRHSLKDIDKFIESTIKNLN